MGRAPWGVAYAGAPGGVRFHYIVRGKAWLTIDKANESRVALSGGDLVMLPQGHTHALRDNPRSRARRWEELAQCVAQTVPGVIHADLGSTGPETTIITGAFVLDDPVAAPMLAALPPLLHLTPDTEQSVPSFLENLQFIVREVDTNRPGADIVLLRMADVLFIQILRAYLARLPDDGGGFLAALRDPNTAAALGAMHRRAEAPWTVASLAEEVGLSRTVFAARFTQLVGEPPLGYLTRLRMQKAATLLRDGARLAEATRQTGYASEASFSHAFRQWSGVAPGAYRKQASK